MILVTGMQEAGRGFTYKVFSEHGDSMTPKIWGCLSGTNHIWSTDEASAISSSLNAGVKGRDLDKLIGNLTKIWNPGKNHLIYKSSPMIFYPTETGRLFKQVIVCVRPMDEWIRSIKSHMNKVNHLLAAPARIAWLSKHSKRILGAKDKLYELGEVFREASMELYESLSKKNGIKSYLWNFGNKDEFFAMLADFGVSTEETEKIWKEKWAGSILEGKGFDTQN